MLVKKQFSFLFFQPNQYLLCIYPFNYDSPTDKFQQNHHWQSVLFSLGCCIQSYQVLNEFSDALLIF